MRVCGASSIAALSGKHDPPSGPPPNHVIPLPPRPQLHIHPTAASVTGLSGDSFSPTAGTPPL
jgi:hypothetical protein